MIVKGFKSVDPMQCMRQYVVDVVMRMGMLGISTMKMKTLTGKGRQNLTCLVYYVYEINSRIFSLIRFFFEGGGGGPLDLYKNIFPWQIHFIWGSS